VKNKITLTYISKANYNSNSLTLLLAQGSRPGVWEITLFSVSSQTYDHLCVWKYPLNSKLLGDKDCLHWIWPVKKNDSFSFYLSIAVLLAGLTKPGEVGEIIALYWLKSLSLDYKAKLKVPCFFLQVTIFLQIIFVLCQLW
jgi:hypothetical protein